MAASALPREGTDSASDGPGRKRHRFAREGETWVAARLSDATKEGLEAWAQRTGSSVSFLLRRLADEALQNGRDKDGMP